MESETSTNNSVLILSTESDSSTSSVIDWLRHLNVGYFRINYLEDSLNVVSSDIDNTYISVNGEVINLSQFTAFWYRKGVVRIADYENVYLNKVSRQLELHVEHERDDMVDFIYREFARDRVAVTTSDNVDVNKLNVLKLAKACRIEIPYSEVVTTKEMVVNMLKKYPSVITKPLSGYHLTIAANGKRYMTFTTKISDDNLSKVPDRFLPSLVQEYIPKKYEIRAFYFWGEFYSMAIFSQQIDQTATDFRKYSSKYPNRTIPFKLPDSLQEKLRLLLNKLGLNTGSVDLIYTPGGRFIFLEVNPVGQFGMVSYPCNYNLEKIIAESFKA